MSVITSNLIPNKPVVTDKLNKPNKPLISLISLVTNL